MNTNYFRTFRSGLVRNFNPDRVLNEETEKALGCAYCDFYHHMMDKLAPGMTPDNMGTVWTISYILGDGEISNDARTHYTNFYPMFKLNPARKRSRTIIPDNVRALALARLRCQATLHWTLVPPECFDISDIVTATVCKRKSPAGTTVRVTGRERKRRRIA